MEVRKIKLSEIRAAEYNPRRDLKPTDDEYKSLKRSIETFGFVEPLIVNERDMKIIGGHQRYKILLDLGETESEVVLVNLNQNDEKILNIALNKIESKWDYGKLEELFEELKGSDLTATGFNRDEICSISELSEMLSPAPRTRQPKSENVAKPPPTETPQISQPFEIYLSFDTKESAENWLTAHKLSNKINNKRTAVVVMD